MSEILKAQAPTFGQLRFWTEKKPRQPRSLCSQLVLWNVVVLVLVLTLVGVIVYSLFVQRLMTETDQRLAERASQIEDQAGQWQASGNVLDNSFFNRLITDGSASDFAYQPLYLRFVDKETGRILAHSTGLGEQRLVINSDISGTPRQDKSVIATRQDEFGHQLRVLIFPLIDKSGQVASLGEINQSLQPIDQVKLILITVLTLGSIIAAIFCYGVGLWLTSRKLQPLSNLATTMHGLSIQGLQTRLPTDQTTIEVNFLTEAFNTMAARLEDSFALQRAFVADVSHELRTPLTSMRGELDVMLLNPELESETRQEIQQLSNETNRLSRLVANLLTNARAETGLLPQVKTLSQPVALDLLVVEIARQGRYLNQQVALEIGELNQLVVQGDRDLLKQLLLNLVDNALTYTGAGGRVKLELQSVLEKGREWAVISVTDNGPGIASEDLPHIFERHFRASHTSARGKLSSGLGLYIACLIARAHSGRIDVQSQPGLETRFSIWLPS